MKLNQLTKQAGFTLVEVLTVMLVLVAIASVTIEVSSDLAFQSRYEVTKDRYEKIKRAIIGRPDVLINGQPDISGFVADMGRLPNNIRELLDDTYCLPDRTIDETDFDDITYASAQLECDGIYGANSWQDISGNWNGPYLTITKGVTDATAFADGWGNTPTDYCTNLTITDQATCTAASETWVTAAANHNYGWYYFVDTSVTPNVVRLLSFGKDQTIGGTTGSYDADYPNNQPAIRENDWQININGFPLRILASSVSGNCVDPSNPSNPFPPPTEPATCALVGGSWTDPSCSGEIIASENDCILLDGTWDAVASSCSGYSISSSDACTQVSGAWSGSGTCLGVVTPSTKLACLSAGGSWSNDSTNNICLKIIDQTGSSSVSSIPQTIIEDGTSQIIHFPYTSPSYVTPGESIGILYTDASCTGPNTYYSSHAKNVCIDTNDDANFTSANCAIQGGVFIDDGSEKYCREVIGVACTDASGTNLGGTEHASLSVMLKPHSILPTLTW